MDKINGVSEDHAFNEDGCCKTADEQIKYAYITFKTLDGKQYAMEAYAKHNTFANRWCSCCQGDETKKAFKGLHIFKRMPEIDESCPPTNILWENVGYSGTQRGIRKCINLIFAILVVLGTLIGTIVLMARMKALASQFNTNVACPNEAVVKAPDFKQKAYADQVNGTNYGFMNCYCKYQMGVNITKFT